MFGPVTRREPKLDVQGRPVRDADGKPVLEIRVVGVKPVSVFDVSQTDGDPLPEPPAATLLTGQAPPGLWDTLQAVVESHGYTVSRGDCGDANGVTQFDARHVRVRADIDDAQAVKTLAHEAAHVALHHPEQRQAFSCRGVVEVEAESVAFLVTAAHGLDASQYTFNYVAGWAHQAATAGSPGVEDIIKATGQRVIGTADRILQATQPARTVVDEALADLAVQVTRPMEAISLASDTTPSTTRWEGLDRTSATSVATRWERVESRPLDGAVRERLALPPSASAPGHTLSR